VSRIWYQRCLLSLMPAAPRLASGELRYQEGRDSGSVLPERLMMTARSSFLTIPSQRWMPTSATTYSVTAFSPDRLRIGPGFSSRIS
jgi:hypothetical protein